MADGGITATPYQRRVIRMAIKDAVRDFARSLDFDVIIPGSHYSGLTNQALLEVRQREGRDYVANNIRLREYVRNELGIKLETGWHIPTESELKTLARPVIVHWFVMRLDTLVRDVRIRALTRDYARQKARDGYGAEPPGIKTGAWRSALEQALIVYH